MERDIRDVMFLAEAGLICRDMLVTRYEMEMEPYITGPTPTWHRTTLKMWIDTCLSRNDRWPDLVLFAVSPKASWC